MRCLIDTFITCLKDEWRSIASCPRKQDIFKLVNAVPKKYRIMFRKLIDEIGSLEQIIDTSEFGMGIEALLVASEYETEDVKFSDWYRGECLQQIIRKTFYDTLLIIENDFSLDKCNQFIVVNSNHGYEQCPHCNGYGSSLKDHEDVDRCTQCGGTGLVKKKEIVLLAAGAI